MLVRRVTREQLAARTVYDVIAENIVPLTANLAYEGPHGMKFYASPAVPEDEIHVYSADGDVHRVKVA